MTEKNKSVHECYTKHFWNENNTQDDEDDDEDNSSVESPYPWHDVCQICGTTPCDWYNLKSEIIFEMEKLLATKKYFERVTRVSNKEVRFHGYRTYIQEKYGFMGEGLRVKIPDCVEMEIKKLYPEDDENDYTYFKYN